MSGMTLHMGDEPNGKTVRVPAGILIGLIAFSLGGGSATAVGNFFRSDTAIVQQLVQLNATVAEMGKTITQLVTDMREVNSRLSDSQRDIARLQERTNLNTPIKEKGP